MNNKIKKPVNTFKKLLQDEFGNHLSQIILFGSYANGKADESSDIDIAVILDSDVNWRIKQVVYDLAYEAESDSGTLINATVFSKVEYDSRSIDSLLLIENIQEQGITI